jgi:hypothetical protein
VIAPVAIISFGRHGIFADFLVEREGDDVNIFYWLRALVSSVWGNVNAWPTAQNCYVNAIYSAGPHCLESQGAERANLCLQMLVSMFWSMRAGSINC